MRSRKYEPGKLSDKDLADPEFVQAYIDETFKTVDGLSRENATLKLLELRKASKGEAGMTTQTVTDTWEVRTIEDIVHVMAGEKVVAIFELEYRAYAERLVRWYNGKPF